MLDDLAELLWLLVRTVVAILVFLVVLYLLILFVAWAWQHANRILLVTYLSWTSVST